MEKVIDQIKDSIKINSFEDLIKNSKSKNNEIYHSNYLLIFIIECILFGALSIYLYNSAKYFIDKLKSTVLYVPKGLEEKYEFLMHLCKATFLRFLSLIYIVIFSNKTGLDLISFINYIFHILPSFIFLMGFYIYIGFLIEKFYELSLSRTYILTSLKYILYFSFLLVLLLLLPSIFFGMYKESYFFIDSVVCINYLLIGFLYLIYGIKIVNFLNESNNIAINNPTAMKNIRKTITYKIISIYFIICPSYIIYGVIKGLVAIDFFGIYYPNFMDLNLLEAIIFLFCELLPSFIIGYTKKKWNNFRIEEFCGSQKIEDFSEISSLKKEGGDQILEEKKSLEKHLEEMLDIFEGEKNQEKFNY